MSIKLIDSLEPNGNFALTEAKHIEVSKPGNITSDLQTIISEMLAAPEISFGSNNSLVTENILPLTRALNAEYTLPIEIKGAASGCQISVVSCLFKDFKAETADGPFSPVLTCTGFNGTNYLRFEKAITTPQDRIYKVVVSDNRGNSGFYQAAGGKTLNYLLFRVTFGDLSLNSSFDTDTLNKVYSATDTTLNYKFSTNYGVSGYRWLFYKRFSLSDAVSSPSVTLSGWNSIALNDGNPIEGGSLYEDEKTFTIFDSTVPEADRLGQHNIMVYVGWSDKQDAVSAAKDNKFAGVLSQASTHHIAVLKPNSASITYLSDFQQNFYSKDYLTVELLPKTNIAVALETANSLKAICSLYEVKTSEPLQVEELEDFRREYLCTPTKKFTYSARQTLADYVTESTTFVWGIKCVRSTATEADIAKAQIYYSSEFTVQLSTTSPYKPEDLLFNFVAEEDKIKYDQDLNCLVWEAESTDDYKIALPNYTSTSEVVKTVLIQDQGTSANQPVVAIRDNGVGVLSRQLDTDPQPYPYSPWQALSGEGATGLTIEAYYHSEAGGSPYSDALTLVGGDDNEEYSHLSSIGLHLGTDSAYIGGGASYTMLPLLSNTWQHVALVIDVRERPEITTTVQNVHGELETIYLALLQIYINGALSQVVTVSRKTLLDTISGNLTSPICLNGRCSSSTIDNLIPPDLKDYLNSLTPTNQGSCQFRFIRGYSTPLTADEIYTNYKNSVHQGLYNKLDTKETSALPKIYFCPISIESSIAAFEEKDATELSEWENEAYKSLKLRKEAWNPENKNLETTTDSKELEKIKQNLLISDLNQVEEKYPTAAMKQAAKNTLTSCIVYCDWQGKGLPDDFEIFEDVEVSLQGTSTLKYTVKNYKIKTYTTDANANRGEGKRSKKKFIPKPVENDWKTDSAVYTLKCDYMEQSHRNNTPTACFYEEKLLPGVLDFAVSQLISSTRATNYRKKQSPAIRYHNESNQSVFRDAIAGFPCELYYTDELRNLTAINCSKNADVLPKSTNSTFKLLGTYMFNIDKEGDQFGFEIGIEDVQSESNQYKNGEISTSYFETELGAAGVLGATEILPCSSIEGSENANMDMGASGFQPYEGLYLSQLQSIFEECPSDKDTLCRITFGNTPSNAVYSTAKQLWLALFTEEDPTADNVTKIEYCYCTETERADEATLSFTELSLIPKTYFERLEKSRDAYYCETLEPRFSYVDEDSPEYFEKTFKPIVDAISWVYRNAENPSTFKNEFTNYFSYEYCLAHYLQLMMFTQVDNASKNTMYDSWGGVVYPRPYDMDTQMGFSNTGEDTKATDSEMHVTLSPLSVTLNRIELPNGKINENNYAVENWATEAAETAPRYKDTYAAQSALWRCFGKYFATDIASAYIYLRKQGIYNVNTICNFVDGLTYDKISAKSYNKDAELKYFPVLSEWSKAVAGDRRNRYRQYLTERMIYLDSLFNYTGTDSLNTSIMLRSNATASETSPFELVIQVHSPQYMRLSQGSGAASYVFYASPTDTYNGGKSKGTLVRFPLKSGNKEITLSGAGNIKALPNLKNLDLTVASLGNASRLTELDLSGSTYLASLSIGSTLLTELDLSNIGTNVKKFSADSEINLASCRFLKTLKLNGAKIGALTLPADTILETLDLRNSTAQNLSLNGAANLSYNSNPSSYGNVTGLCLTNSTAFSRISLINCPKINLSDFSTFTNLTALTINGCPLIKNINLKLLKKLEELNFDSAITSIDLTSAEWSTAVLNFSSLINLQTLTLKSAKASANNSAIVLADNLKDFNLDANSSNISIIVPAAKYNTHSTKLSDICGLYDFTSINVKTLTLKNNEKIQKLCNLNYTGNLESFFSQCISLNTISDCSFTASNSSMYQAFYNCNSLTEFSSTSWHLEAVTRAQELFSYCTSLKYSSIKNLIDNLTNVTNLNGMLSFALDRTWPSSLNMSTIPTTPDASQITELLDKVFCFIPSDFFSNNKKLTTLTSCFRDATTLFFVEDDVFSNLPLLGDIENIFLYNKNLCYVPSNIMAQSPITKVNYAFGGCSSLGATALNKADTKDEAEKELPQVLFNWISNKLTNFTSQLGQIPTDTIFNNQTAGGITSIEGLFYGCSKFTAASGWLNQFFTELPGLTNADVCFYNCTALQGDLTKIISNENIASLRGTFAGTGIASLPETIFDDEKDFEALESISGIFAGCKQLEGILGDTFFANTANIKNIGLVMSVPAIDGTRIALPGAFANTKLTGCTTKCLQKLTLLEDCSTLFYQGTCNATTGVLTPTNVAGERTFNIYDEDGNTETTLRAEFFSKNTLLKSVAYCFTYAFIKNKTDLTNISSSLLKAAGSTIKDISGLFLGCSAITTMEYDGTITDPKPNSLDVFFSYLTELTYAQGLFADTSLVAEVTSKTFMANSKLSVAKAMFMNTNLTSSIPVELFNYCRDKLTDTSYMFAGCDSLTGAIGTGCAIINDPDAVITRNNNAIAEIKDKHQSLYALVATQQIYALALAELNRILELEGTVDAYTNDIFKYDIDRQFLRQIEQIDKIDKLSSSEFASIREAIEDKTKITFDTESTSYSDLYSELTSAQQKDLDKYKLPHEDEIENFSLNLDAIIVIKQKGLLSDCNKLKAVHHMFAGCKHLYGPIPADMFYFSRPNNLITSIEGLFENCFGLTLYQPSESLSNVYGTSSVLAYTTKQGKYSRFDHLGGGNFEEIYPDLDIVKTEIEGGTISATVASGYLAEAKYFIPKDWLVGLPNLSTISKAFFHVGTVDNTRGSSRYIAHSHDRGSYNEGIADSIFDGCKYSMLELPNSCFSAQKSIEDASYAFAQVQALSCTTLTSIFLADSLATLTNISYIFASATIKEIQKTFERSSGQSSPISNAKWAFCGLNIPTLAQSIVKTESTKLTGTLPAFWNTSTMFTRLTDAENVFGHKESMEALVSGAEVLDSYWKYNPNTASHRLSGFSLFKPDKTFNFLAGYDANGKWTKKTSYNIGITYTKPNYDA